jgi:uncharacterized protein (TIGR03067 family)
MRGHRHLALLVTVLAVGGAAADDSQLFQGKWKVVSAEQRGQPAGELEGVVVIFSKDEVTVERKDGETKKGTFKLDASKSPKEITITPADEQEKPLLGIYAFEKDQLKLCFNESGEKVRPSGFVTRADSQAVVLVLKQEKK